jgi:hypothetical protein
MQFPGGYTSLDESHSSDGEIRSGEVARGHTSPQSVASDFGSLRFPVKLGFIQSVGQFANAKSAIANIGVDDILAQSGCMHSVEDAVPGACDPTSGGILFAVRLGIKSCTPLAAKSIQTALIAPAPNFAGSNRKSMCR